MKKPKSANEYHVFVYAEDCQPLEENINLFLFKDHTAVQLSAGLTRPVPGEAAWGALLPFFLPQPAPVTLLVHDDSNRYAGNSYFHLNGAQPARLDISLYRLPQAPGGFGGGHDGLPPGGPAGGPNPFDEAKTYLEIVHVARNHPEWTPAERKAVVQEIQTYAGFIAPLTVSADRRSDLVKVQRAWAKCLARFGIDAAALAAHSLVGSPAGGGMVYQAASVPQARATRHV